jgi:hypothetical protein
MAFYFAWVGPGETTFVESSHAVEDEQIFGFEIAHAEGEFATLAIDIVNPHIGLLNEARYQWAWLSYDTGTSDGIVPLFFGRLVGIPQDLHDEVVRLQFIARPLDYESQKEALAETLRVAPYWDAVWLADDARIEPDTVLESRAALWHIDRTTLDVTVSDILTGEEGPLNVTAHFYDSMRISYDSPPGKACNIKANAVWHQKAAGEIDITSEFPNYIASYTGQGLIEDWPDTDTSIGGGWTVVSSEPRPYFNGAYSSPGTIQTFDTAYGGLARWYVYYIVPSMNVRYDADREYSETLELTVAADVQNLLTDAGDDETITIDVSAEVDQPIDPAEESGGELQMPIRDLRARRYFQTERGTQSVDYLVCLARAHLLSRSRAVEIGFTIPFADAIYVSCRYGVTITDSRLPGGTATGKVKGYTLSLNGDTGQAICEITIGCAIGNGGTIAADAGTETYVADGYVASGYQVMSGETHLVAGDVAVPDFSDQAITDDGVDWTALTAAQVVNAVTIYNGAAEQQAIVASGGEIWAMAALLKEAYTEIELDMIDAVGGPFETTFAVSTSQLKVPQGINLTAGAV